MAMAILGLQLRDGVGQGESLPEPGEEFDLRYEAVPVRGHDPFDLTGVDVTPRAEFGRPQAQPRRPIHQCVVQIEERQTLRDGSPLLTGDGASRAGAAGTWVGVPAAGNLIYQA
ncbi:hypothetical protein HerbRD11066_41020 [Herbidospora sp. RD11066]